MRILLLLLCFFLVGYGGGSKPHVIVSKPAIVKPLETNLQTKYKDNLTLDAVNPKIIEGLKEGVESGLINTETLNRLLIQEIQGSDHKAHLVFPCGTYYFASPVKFQLRAALDWILTLKISECTTVASTGGVTNQSLFYFMSSDQTLNNAKFKLYGGGTVDISRSSHKSGKAAWFTNNHALWFDDLNLAIIDKINFIGNPSTTDDFITGVAKKSSIRNCTFNGAADAAVYLNGVRVNGEEQTLISFTHDNTYNNVRNAVTCKRGISHCVVYNETVQATQSGIGSYGVSDSFSENPYPAKKMTVFNNKIISPIGISLDWCTECQVANNTIFGSSGVILKNTQDSMVYGNVFNNVSRPFIDIIQLRQYGTNKNSRQNPNNKFIRY